MALDRPHDIGFAVGFRRQANRGRTLLGRKVQIRVDEQQFRPARHVRNRDPELSSNVVTINVNLASAYRIVQTGCPGAAGFGDNRGDKLTSGNFKSGGVPTALYFGFRNLNPGCTNNDCHWSLFGYANDAVATTAPMRSASLQELLFTVSKRTSITEVPRLLQRFIPSSGNAPAYLPAYLIVDARAWVSRRCNCGITGLFAAIRIPEPVSLALLASGLLRRKRVV